MDHFGGYCDQKYYYLSTSLVVNPAVKYANFVMPVPDQVQDDGSGIQYPPG
jgi:hypothetical protein